MIYIHCDSQEEEDSRSVDELNAQVFRVGEEEKEDSLLNYVVLDWDSNTSLVTVITNPAWFGRTIDDCIYADIDFVATKALAKTKLDRDRERLSMMAS